MPEILYQDNRILVCVKPSGVLSVDEAGGMPALLRAQLGDARACVRTVHRLDQPVGGVMVYARSRKAEQLLSSQITSHKFHKIYLAVVHGTFSEKSGSWCDLLLRNRAERKTYVVSENARDTHEARLHYCVIDENENSSLLRIQLETGRTHQIRAQCAAHGHPIIRDRNYGGEEGEYPALFSTAISLMHPQTNERMQFSSRPPKTQPWTQYPIIWTREADFI